jgi:hypothetical protein
MIASVFAILEFLVGTHQSAKERDIFNIFNLTNRSIS